MSSLLCEVQAALHAPKSRHNSFGKYNYRAAEDILEAVKPLLTERGMRMTLSDEIIEVCGAAYVKATATLICPDCEPIVVTACARHEDAKKGMDASQITGAASSYARKYALNGLFLIDDSQDSDATNTHGKDKPQPASKPAKQSSGREAKVAGAISILGSDCQRAVDYFVSSGKLEDGQGIKDLPDNIIDAILERPDALLSKIGG